MTKKKKPTIWKRKDGRWHACVPAHKPDHTTYRKNIYGKTKAEVQQKIEQWEKEDQERSIPSFETVADQWNEMHKKEVKYNTWASYQAPVKDLIAMFGNRPINEITPLQIQAFLYQMAQTQKSRQTIALRLIAMRQIFRYAVLHQWVTVDPTAACSVPKQAKKAKKVGPPSAKDIQSIKKNVNDPFGLFAFMGYWTGARRAELLALRWCDVDFDQNTISIDKSLVWIDRKPVIQQGTKTQSGTRTIPLLTPLRNELKSRMPKSQAQQREQIFTNANGELMTKSQFNVAWHRYARDTGISCTPHQLRHAYAQLCYDADLTAKDAQYFLGHAKLETTENIYTQWSQQKLHGNAEKLNNYVMLKEKKQNNKG